MKTRVIYTEKIGRWKPCVPRRVRAARVASVFLALGSFGLMMSGNQLEALAMVSSAVLLGSLGGAP